MKIIKQSTAITKRYGPFLSSSDGDTELNSLIIPYSSVLLSKNGGDIAAKNDTSSMTFDQNGFYSTTLNTTDTNTLGSLEVYVHPATSMYVYECFQVVTPEVYELIAGNTANLDTRLDTTEANIVTILKTISNKKALIKDDAGTYGDVGKWYIVIYDDNGTTHLYRKELQDKDGATISDLLTGQLAAEIASQI